MTTPDKHAFPSAAIDPQFGGMSLRQWYAGMAMQGWMASYDVNCDHPCQNEHVAANIARWSFSLADAMIAEGEKRNV